MHTPKFVFIASDSLVDDIEDTTWKCWWYRVHNL